MWSAAVWICFLPTLQDALQGFHVHEKKEDAGSCSKRTAGFSAGTDAGSSDMLHGSVRQKIENPIQYLLN